MSKIHRGDWSVLGAVLLSGTLGACGGEPIEQAETGAVESNREALAVADKIFTDGSGDVQIMVRTCDYPATATTGPRCHFCAVDAGWVMIGGGAEIEGSPSSARLRGSFPFPGTLVPPVHTADSLETCTGNSPANPLTKDYTAWMVRSGGSSSHRLRAYVIGLKVAGMLEDTLATYRIISDGTSEFLTQPTLEYAAGDFLLLGGGANEVGAQNCYLTESRPVESTNSWRASAYCSPASGLKVYSISIDPCLPVPGWYNCMQWKHLSAVTGPTTGYGTASLATPYPWVTTAIGAKGVVNFSSSRFLADLLPVVGSSQGFTATTKDQGTTVNGTTTGHSIGMFGGRWGTWLFNSVRFNTAGTTLHRPGGSAPVQLMQSTAFPDAGPFRWYVEPLGGGEFRLRNANPNQPAQGECAFRQSGTSNVQVGPCGTGSQYRWTIVDDLQGSPFKLRNVSSNTCLDNNSSAGNTALRLATCVTGYSVRQSLFLDHFSWP